MHMNMSMNMNMNIEDLGLGKQEIYAGGWQVKGCGGEMLSEYLIIFEVALNNCKIWVHILG